MASLKSLNSLSKKITKKQKNTGQRETFFGKSYDLNEGQFESDISEAAGPFLAKVIFKYNEDGGGKIVHDTTFGGALAAIGNFFGIGGETNKGILTVKARLVDLYDAGIPEPELIGKAAMEGTEADANQKGKSAVLIDLHDTFTALSEEANNLTLKVGDIIIVDYRDRKNKKNGFIIDKYWSSETEGEQSGDTTTASGADTSTNPSAAMPTQVTNPIAGKCGKLFEETNCASGGAVVVNGKFGPFTSSEISELTPKLNKLRDYKYTAIQSYTTESSAGNYYINVTYNYTKAAKINGHPDLIILMQTLFEKVVKSWSTPPWKDPITPATMMVGSTYRSPEAQIALRRSNCKGLSESEIMTAPSTKCNPWTAPPGSSMHERGEGIDFYTFDLEKWEASGFKDMSFIGFSMSNAPKICRQKLNKWIYDNYQMIDLTEKTASLKSKNITKMSWKRLNAEGWHFSTNGR